MKNCVTKLGYSWSLFACVIAAGLGRPCAAEEPAFAAEVDRLVQPYLDESIVVGITVGAIRGDETLVRGYGRVRKDDSTKPDGKTVYEMGSITKTFTGLLLADAVVRGELSLDQPVGELLPDGATIPQHDEGPILLKHLATHVSGLPRMPDNMAPANPRDPYADYTAEDLYAFLRKHSLQNGPVKKLEYSNLAFGLLGQLLADRAGKTYGELVQARIAKPLAMPDTHVELTDSMRKRLAPPYKADLAADVNWQFQAIAGAGALRSTVDDMVRYARAHLNPPAGPGGKAIELAWQVHQPGIADGDFAVGLGWHVARDGSTRWHNGQTGGYHSMLLVNRPLRIGVVVLSNTATMEVDQLAEQLVRMLAGVPEKPRSFEKSVSIDVAPEKMKRLVGQYQLAPNFALTVTLDDGKLMVGATGQQTFQVFATSETEWHYRVVDAQLTFELEDEGPAKAVVLHQNGANHRGARVGSPASARAEE